MEFSEPFQIDRKVEPVFSPGDGRYAAFLQNGALTLVDVESCDVVCSVPTKFPGASKAQRERRLAAVASHRIIWSEDASFIAVAGSALIEVYSASEECRLLASLTPGSRGFNSKFTQFTPPPMAPRYMPAILTVSPCASILSVWSLVSCTATTIRNPTKFQVSRRYTHDSPNLLAVLERHDAVDYLAAYTIDGDDLHRVSRFQTSTRQASDLAWSPTSPAIAVWDTVLDCRMQIYSPEGLLLREDEPYQDALGIKQVQWSPAKALSLIAVATCDNSVRLYSGISGSLLMHFVHTPSLKGDTIPIYVEVRPSQNIVSSIQNQDPNSLAETQSGSPSYYTIHQGEFFMPVSADSAKMKEFPAASVGISQTAWSPYGRFLATVSAEYPRVVWIWSVPRRQKVAVACHLSSVRSMAWDPSGLSGDNARLAIVTGTGDVYLWTPRGTSCVQVPADEFRANSVQWSEAAESRLLVADERRFCVMFG